MTNEMKHDIECINCLSPYTLKLNKDNVFIFQIQLLDNDIDSDNEYFSDQAVYDMSRMFLGKTGFCDSSTARIFRTWVEPENKKTKDGRDYIVLYARAYMVKTKDNEDIIKEISAGIKKEVSISCSVNKRICSICGTNRIKEQCPHKKGHMGLHFESVTMSSACYSSCYYILDEVTDVYEWSFVVPPIAAKKTNGTLTDSCSSTSSSNKIQAKWIKTGRTNGYDETEYKCSNCQVSIYVPNGSLIAREKYCYNCGAEITVDTDNNIKESKDNA